MLVCLLREPSLGLFQPVALDEIQRYMVEEHPGTCFLQTGKASARSVEKAPGRRPFLGPFPPW